MSVTEIKQEPALDSLSTWLGALGRQRSSHPESVRILDILERLLDKPYRTHAIILGEPGTGKEGLARALHSAMHPRANAPFVKVQSGGRDPETLCHLLFGTLRSPGAIDRAEGGTLYLDEIATLDREVQARLAPTLRGRFRRQDDEQPRPCNIVMITATDQDLREQVDRGTFRHDFYHRLARVVVRIPALRERPGDIAPAAIWIANRLLDQNRVGKHLALEGESEPGDIVLASDAIALLAAQQWRGNFRELDVVVERALFLYRDGDVLTADVLRAALDTGDAHPLPKSP